MAEVTSGNGLTVIVLDEAEADALEDIFNSHPTLNEDYPILGELAEALVSA
jgi:hypothetical protein